MAIAIGDIHGCLRPLMRLIERLPVDEELVFLGDYIDRGPDSAGVVNYLRELHRERACRFLKGNHEDMMWNAIEDADEIAVWLINGGQATLESYGVRRGQWSNGQERGAFLTEHADFFEKLDIYYENEHTIFVHAGVDVTIPDMACQSPQVLMWIREGFHRNAQQWQGKEIIFGHTPTRYMGLSGKDIFRNGRVYGIDTGCCYGGYLTAIDARTHEVYQEASDFSY
ncbi:MAG: metallophosphoesterase family protein [SAR324 cluster bacterium]|nr:metallophosphoesterase family protein [SAR324 cluster bacterium]